MELENDDLKQIKCGMSMHEDNKTEWMTKLQLATKTDASYITNF